MLCAKGVNDVDGMAPLVCASILYDWNMTASHNLFLKDVPLRIFPVSFDNDCC